jgi:hypothetical protein
MRKGDQLCILRAEVKTDADANNLLRLVGALTAIGVALDDDCAYLETRELIESRERRLVTWTLKARSACGEYDTRKLIDAWHDPAWTRENPEQTARHSTTNFCSRSSWSFPSPRCSRRCGISRKISAPSRPRRSKSSRARAAAAKPRATPKLIEPVWTASFVFTLARETGWPEQFIVWELPLARLLQYQHCALRAHDAWTVSVAPSAAHQLDALLAHWTPNELPPAF